jgi:glycosyltransferase involved in cell wall biosynthesis
MKKENLSISIFIVAYNEEENLGRCLKSIADLASEIVIVDSGSSDRTLEIAESYGALVFTEDWKGFMRQKNYALSKCTKDWILALDADEEVTKELKASIKRAIKEDIKDGYLINRRTFYLGKLLKHSWQPDYILRLVKRQSSPCWEGYDPHPDLHVIGSIEKLKGDLIHYSYKSIRDHVERLSHYAYVAAQSYNARGTTFHIYNLIFNPLFAFIKKYIIKAGLLDGLRGLLVAALSSFYVFLKYSYLWEMSHEKEGEK